jgi:hypothetical protein
MKQEDRARLFEKLLGPPLYDTVIPGMRKELEELITKDLDDIEPIIDEMLKTAAESLLWDPAAGAWQIAIKIGFHSAVQLLAFLKAYEWQESRPGYHRCAECHIEFQATPIEGRQHHRECRIAGLIRELQSQIVKIEGSTSHAFSEHSTST